MRSVAAGIHRLVGHGLVASENVGMPEAAPKRPRLSGRDDTRTVKRTAGADAVDFERYAGHSLRAGLATSTAIAGVEERAIMAQTGHRSVAVARRSIRDGSLFRGNAAAAVGP